MKKLHKASRVDMNILKHIRRTDAISQSCIHVPFSLSAKDVLNQGIHTDVVF